MISGKENLETSERLDEIELKMLRSLRVSEEEIEAVAASPNLYDRVRQRIEDGSRQQCNDRGGLHLVPVQTRTLLWLAAAAAVLLLAVSLLVWRPSPSSTKQDQIVELPSPTSSASSQQEFERNVPPGKPGPLVGHDSGLRSLPGPSLGASRRRRARTRSIEVATDFFPLTFIADSTALESGQVVRVRVPRSALVSFGVPMNVERAGELVKADVVIGDDGLARAIRFIQ